MKRKEEQSRVGEERLQPRNKITNLLEDGPSKMVTKIR
jgi:hypothetical protein